MADLQTKAAAEAARINKSYGDKTGALGSQDYKLNVLPTGSLALDYALGIGGWPKGHPVEVFGPPDIGKSSVVGLSAFRNAQAEGMLCGLIALEPGFDPEWARKNGVDPDALVIARPDDGETAFEILYEWVSDDIVDCIVFDSIGAVVSRSELDQDEFKSKVGGQSKLITDGMKRILIPCWKNNKVVIVLNQIRDIIGSPVSGAVDSPGGRALKHTTAIKVQLKQSGKPITEKVDGEDVMVARTIVAHIKRNKLNEGTNQRAEFDFWQKSTDEHPIGIDVGKDVVSTAIRMRIINKAGAWFTCDLFDTDEKFQGRAAVEQYIVDNPQIADKVRNAVLAKMPTVQNIQPVIEDGEEGNG